MRAIIFVNGQFHNPEIARNLIQPNDYIIAVNGGTCHALSLDIVPHVIIGDLDSLSPDLETRLKASHANILRFPVRKDETDLELAIQHALAKHALTIVLFAALGGRMDQSLANIFLLTLPGLQGVDVHIVDGNQTAFLIRNQASIPGKPGDTVSIIPIGGDAIGVTNTGFEWPLTEETLALGTTRGISNILLQKHASIRVRKGMLLCVVIHT